MSFRDIPTTTATSGMEPFQILLGGFQPLTLADRGVTGGFFLSVARSAPEFHNLSDSVIVILY